MEELRGPCHKTELPKLDATTPLKKLRRPHYLPDLDPLSMYSIMTRPADRLKSIAEQDLLYTERESECTSILEATAGLLFLGAPFRGSKLQPLAEYATALMKPIGSRDGIVKNLGYDDPDLRVSC
ncbi:Vegetative incompatibility protein HET-E-1 [Apiospora arundinis]|uniref:Vegetative incompatibility protein HET-E-1 n=1 Tax=Apiospora arundinis TaxID=335852 RepID=A0ABR2I906_9PEZI